MKIIRTVIAAALLQAVAATGALAADELAAIKASGVFKIGTEGVYPPFSYHDASGKLTGFDVEIAEAVAQRLNVKPEFIEGKWDGLIAGLDVNRYNAVINQVAITEARQAKYDFSTPYIKNYAVLIVQNDNKAINEFKDLKGKRSANTLTSNYGRIALANGAEIVQVQGFNESIELLASGRVDATVNAELSWLDFKKKQPNAQLKVVAIDSPGDSDSSGILIRKGNPELLAALNKALAEMKADGTYLKIAEKYFGKDVSQ